MIQAVTDATGNGRLAMITFKLTTNGHEVSFHRGDFVLGFVRIGVIDRIDPARIADALCGYGITLADRIDAVRIARDYLIDLGLIS
jgi:hypothetical protein